MDRNITLAEAAAHFQVVAHHSHEVPGTLGGGLVMSLLKDSGRLAAGALRGAP
jgi:hypothetical protein